MNFENQTQWAVVTPDDTKEVLAVFKLREWAETWAHENSRTSTVEEYVMPITLREQAAAWRRVYRFLCDRGMAAYEPDTSSISGIERVLGFLQEALLKQQATQPDALKPSDLVPLQSTWMAEFKEAWYKDNDRGCFSKKLIEEMWKETEQVCYMIYKYQVAAKKKQQQTKEAPVERQGPDLKTTAT